ncbi:uncharacterized protein A4U43_C05F11400 [Asparagus officinalis]|uniref:HMA domain-containing protein n=1 Tax=Asparagus officinalis TaxID=4686 RepID=A0A5P1EQZ5_ASPOF|nr:phosphoinositide phospholipase C 4-like [Asparagus officinalis]ONK68428.1 uncharacterized protein A4U43_C05F11400 [Asparagus officinalis]
MSSDNFRRFLVESQGNGGVSGEEADRIFDQTRQQRQRHIIGKLARSMIAVEDFHHYLFDEELNPPLKSQTVILRVSTHCNGCERKVKKHIKKMECVADIQFNAIEGFSEDCARYYK